MKTVPIAVLVIALLASAPVSAQVPDPLDFSLAILPGGVPVPGLEVVYALVVNADWWTDRYPAFEVRLIVPAGLEPVGSCTGEMRYDAVTRLLVWTDRLDNEYLAEKSCPLVFRLDPTLPPGTSFTLSATLTTVAADRNPNNNIATHTGTALAASDLEVTTDVDMHNYKPGETVTFTVGVTNHGPQDAPDVYLVDDISIYLEALSFTQLTGPAATLNGTEARIPLLRVRESATFRIVARARTNFETANVRNRAMARSSSFDLQTNNNEVDLWTFVGPDADLTARSERVPDPSPARVPLIVRVANDGPDAVNEVTVSHSIVWIDASWEVEQHVKFARVTPSQGTCSAPVLFSPIITPPLPPYWVLDCSLGALASGAEATIEVLIERTPLAGSFRVYSGVSPNHNDPRPENNVGQVVVDPAAARRRAVRK